MTDESRVAFESFAISKGWAITKLLPPMRDYVIEDLWGMWQESERRVREEIEGELARAYKLGLADGMDPPSKPPVQPATAEDLRAIISGRFIPLHEWEAIKSRLEQLAKRMEEGK